MDREMDKIVELNLWFNFVSEEFKFGFKICL